MLIEFKYFIIENIFVMYGHWKNTFVRVNKI